MENEIKFKDKLQLKKFPVIKILSNASVDSNEGIIELPNTETIDFLTKSNGNLNFVEKIEKSMAYEFDKQESDNIENFTFYNNYPTDSNKKSILKKSTKVNFKEEESKGKITLLKKL